MNFFLGICIEKQGINTNKKKEEQENWKNEEKKACWSPTSFGDSPKYHSTVKSYRILELK